MVLREEDRHVPATAAVCLVSPVDHHAAARVREKVKARYVMGLTIATHFSVFQVKYKLVSLRASYLKIVK
jgi:hypothetical protein